MLQDGKLEEAVLYGRSEFDKFKKSSAFDDLVKVRGRRSPYIKDLLLELFPIFLEDILYVKHMLLYATFTLMCKNSLSQKFYVHDFFEFWTEYPDLDIFYSSARIVLHY